MLGFTTLTPTYALRAVISENRQFSPYYMNRNLIYKIVGIVVTILIVSIVLHDRLEEIAILLGEAVLGAVILAGIMMLVIFWSNWIDKRKWDKKIISADHPKDVSDEKFPEINLSDEQKNMEPREIVDTCEGFDLSPEEKKEREEYRQKIKEATAGKLEQSKEKLIDAVLNGPRNKS